MATTCDGWCPLCYSNAKGRSNYRGHLAYRRPRRVEGPGCMALKKREPASSNGSGQSAAACTSLLDQTTYPLSWEFLFSMRWEDGSARVPGTLLIFTDLGRLKVCLSDRDQALVAFAVVGSTSEIFPAVERLLGDPGADWRAQRRESARPSPKR